MVQDKGFSVSTLESYLLQYLLPALWTSPNTQQMEVPVIACVIHTYIEIPDVPAKPVLAYAI